MITLLGSLLGFVSAAFPDLLKIWRDASDKQHEITLLKMQMDYAAQGSKERIEEISTNGDIAESLALYKTYNTGVKWVDALNGTVRPVIAYAFFILYAFVKLGQFSMIHDAPWLIWGEEDQAIFAGIISFYFGERALSKMRQRSV